MGFDLGGKHKQGGSAPAKGSAITSSREPTPCRESAICRHLSPRKLLVEAEAQRRQKDPHNDDPQNLLQTKHLTIENWPMIPLNSTLKTKRCSKVIEAGKRNEGE
jgi:hypothetical protein